MTFRTRNLWDDFALFPKDFDHWFDHYNLPVGNRYDQAHYPPVNLEVSPENYDYYIFAAGIDKDQLEISAEHKSLTFSGEKPKLIPQGQDVKVYRSERLCGKFSRTLKLPDDVDIEHISAKYHNGVLHIQAHRMGKATPTAIKIK